MKFILLASLLLFFRATCTAQDAALMNRVNEMLKFTQVKDLDKVMDYTYPKLFDIVPKEMMIANMKSAFDTDEFTIVLDSMKIINIYPIFKIADTSYVKIKHSMLMRMKYKAPYDSTNAEETNFMITFMEQKYGAGNVRFDQAANSLTILLIPDMVGIKPGKEWKFINLNDDNPEMMDMILSKKVIEKLKEFR